MLYNISSFFNAHTRYSENKRHHCVITVTWFSALLKRLIGVFCVLRHISKQTALYSDCKFMRYPDAFAPNCWTCSDISISRLPSHNFKERTSLVEQVHPKLIFGLWYTTVEFVWKHFSNICMKEYFKLKRISQQLYRIIHTHTLTNHNKEGKLRGSGQFLHDVLTFVCTSFCVDVKTLCDEVVTWLTFCAA